MHSGTDLVTLQGDVFLSLKLTIVDAFAKVFGGGTEHRHRIANTGRNASRDGTVTVVVYRRNTIVTIEGINPRVSDIISAPSCQPIPL